MIISIDIAQLKATIEEETSRVAARSYAEDGSSLYDAIVIKSRDKDLIDRTIIETVTTVRSAIEKFLDFSHIEAEGKLEFKFILTERRAMKKDVFYANLIRNILVQLVIANYLNRDMQVEDAKRYDEMAALNMKMLIKEVYSKMPPKRMKENR